MTRKYPNARAFDIPTVDKSLRRDLLSGAITIEQAREELIQYGWFLGGESTIDTYQRIGLLPEIKRT